MIKYSIGIQHDLRKLGHLLNMNGISLLFLFRMRFSFISSVYESIILSSVGQCPSYLIIFQMCIFSYRWSINVFLLSSVNLLTCFYNCHPISVIILALHFSLAVVLIIVCLSCCIFLLFFTAVLSGHCFGIFFLVIHYNCLFLMSLHLSPFF